MDILFGGFKIGALLCVIAWIILGSNIVFQVTVIALLLVIILNQDKLLNQKKE